MSRRSGVAAVVAVPLLIVFGVPGLLLLQVGTSTVAGPCGPAAAGAGVDQTTVPAGPIAGYRGEQLVNAAYVMNAAQALGLDARAQTIGVMTAMGESSLLVLDRGDVAGADSRGLFQQRDNGAWGSYSDRMDPTISSTNFFNALQAVQGWETLAPTIAAHHVQRNADPYYYEQFWDPAVEVVQALTGTAITGVAAGTGGIPCTGTAPGALIANGWTKPAVGPVTSNYGKRLNPITGVYRLHAGTDIGAPCEAPIYAAAAGKVVAAGASQGYGNLIVVDHGDGVATRSAHMYNNAVLVQVGQPVAAGQQIARVGSNGNSTGCHLHFEVRVGDEFTDPAPFMAQRGAALG